MLPSPDLMMREGIHPETPRLPFTPGWDLVGIVDRLGDDVSGIEPGQVVAALPISGAYAEFVCLPSRELVPVPSGLDAAEAVSSAPNYVTAYQMLHRLAKAKPGQRALIHGAAGGVGSALVAGLGRLARLEMYGTCSPRGVSTVSDLGGVPIDYQHLDFVEEIRRLTSQGVDVVFDGIGGTQHPGAPARGFALAGGLWPMASLGPYGGDDWPQVVEVVVIAFAESLSLRFTSLAAGFSRAGDGWFPTVSSG